MSGLPQTENVVGFKPFQEMYTNIEVLTIGSAFY